MNYETSIHTSELVDGFDSEQRFHQTHHVQIMLQRHVKCSSVQHRMTMKHYLIKSTNLRGKNDVLLSSHYLTLAS